MIWFACGQESNEKLSFIANAVLKMCEAPWQLRCSCKLAGVCMCAELIGTSLSDGYSPDMTTGDTLKGNVGAVAPQ